MQKIWNLNLIRPLDLITCFQEMENTEGLTENTTEMKSEKSGIGNYRTNNQFLQQVNCKKKKEKKREREGPCRFKGNLKYLGRK